MTVSQPRGPKFVTGQTNSHGRIVLTREDGTVSTPLPLAPVFREQAQALRDVRASGADTQALLREAGEGG